MLQPLVEELLHRHVRWANATGTYLGDERSEHALRLTTISLETTSSVALPARDRIGGLQHSQWW